MLVLLPPSETKAPGGQGAPLRVEALSFPALNPIRDRVLDALRDLSRNVALARKTLKLSAHQDAELEVNERLRTAPTLPALERYTGVLYDALDYPTLTGTARRRADASLVVVSALFGAVRARDRIPAYRLSGGTTLPGLGPLRGVWRPGLEPVLTAPGAVLDLRSAAYQALAPVPGAITVRVVSPRPDGSRIVVSHHNKSHKGLLARAICTAPGAVRGVAGILRAASAAGLCAEAVGPRHLELLTPP